MHLVETDRLIERTLDGDLAAFGDLIDLYQADVWKTVSALLRDRDRAEDLVQEAFIRAYHELHRYEIGRDFSVWLKTLARNLVRNELRRHRREIDRLVLYGNALEAEFAGESDSERGQPPQEAALVHCLERLPPPAAEVVRLRYEHALEFESIARKLNRTVPAVRQFLSRARLWLRDCVEGEMRRL